MNTVETLRALQAAMAAQGLDAYLVPTADPHGSEYVSPHHKARAFMTGFTGSAGNLLVTKQDAGCLWIPATIFRRNSRSPAAASC